MFYAIVAVIALILDQALKYWTSVNIVENTAGYTEVRPLIPGILRLTNFHNSGAAFSFLANASWARWFFVVLCLIFVAIVIYALLRDIIPSPGARWAAVFVMAGAIGNCIDRMITGYVVDMLEFDFTVFGHRFPVFNLADVYITVGAIVFVIFMLLEKPKKQTAAPRPAVRAAMPPQDGARVHVSIPVPVAPPEAEETDGEEDVVLTSLFDGAKEPEKPAPPVPAQKKQTGRIPLTRPAEETEGNKAPSKTELVMRTLVRGRAEEQPAIPAPVESKPVPATESAPAAPRPVPTVPEPRMPETEPPAKAEAEPSYDLDDILAEFRDS